MLHTITIDNAICTGCGTCVRICPADCLTLSKIVKVEFSDKGCIGCEHCVAVCPAGVLTGQRSEEKFIFESFPCEPESLHFPSITPGRLATFLQQRRSCRLFSKQPVPVTMLRDLVRLAITAPSGTNSQGWTFCLLGSRPEVVRFGEGVAGFYRSLNRLAVNPVARLYSRIVHGDALGRYRRRHYDSVAKSLAEWQEGGRDRLFHGAPAAIVIGGKKNASCPQEDALLACQNLLLGATAMGLGSCMIGYAVEAMRRDRSLCRDLSFPDDEDIYAVVVLGYPAVTFLRSCGRKVPIIRRPVYADPEGED